MKTAKKSKAYHLDKDRNHRDKYIYYLRSVQHKKYHTKQLSFAMIAKRVGLTESAASRAWKNGYELWKNESADNHYRFEK